MLVRLICIMNHFKWAWLCFLGKQEKSWMRPHDYLHPRFRILKQPFSLLAKLVYNGSNILSSEECFQRSAIFKTMIIRYLIKLPSADPCSAGLILNYNRFIIHPKHAPFSDWFKGQLVLTIFGRCEQYTIDSMIHFIGNEVDWWYIWLETRLHGK